MTLSDLITWCNRNQINVCDERKLVKAVSDYTAILEREHIIKKNHNTDIEITDPYAFLDFLFEMKVGWYLFSMKHNGTRPPTSTIHIAGTTKRKQLLILH